MKQLILASKSPRRRELLTQMGVGEFAILSPEVEEIVDNSLTPAEIVQSLALQKAQATQPLTQGNPVIIGADTIVVADGAILGKPKDEGDALAMLDALSGKSHQVFTGIALVEGEKAVTSFEATTVTFRTLSPEEKQAYVQTGEPMDKAGGYGIQGYGALLIEGICGDYFNVVGLPICKLGQMLQGFGIGAMGK